MPLRTNQTKYTPTPGTLALRPGGTQAAAGGLGAGLYHRGDCGQRGGKPILYVALKTLLNPGDEVILPRLLGELLRAD